MIREKDARYINLPIVVVSLINATVWTAYAVLKKDIPLFMTNCMALAFMSINMTFYLWAVDSVATSSIQTMISFFQVAFPDEEAKFDEDDAVCERNLDEEDMAAASDVEYRTKAEVQAHFKRTQLNGSSSLMERPTEETRLTTNSNDNSFMAKSMTTSRSNNPYYYTGSAFDEDEESKSANGDADMLLTTRNQRETLRQGSSHSGTVISDFTMNDESAIDFALRDDDATGRSIY